MSDELRSTATALVAEGKGILAADESNGTMDKRLKAAGVERDRGDAPRAARAAVHDGGRRRAHQRRHPLRRDVPSVTADGTPFPKLLEEPGRRARHQGRHRRQAAGRLRGREGDRGPRRAARAARRLLRGRGALREVAGGHRPSTATLPSDYCLHANAHALARYAALCQEANIVPIVEPEVLMDGEHTIDRSEAGHRRRRWRRSSPSCAGSACCSRGCC